jgi:pimeloyl-ACP methyl ester carboxylesterase
MAETSLLSIGKERIAYQTTGSPQQPAVLWVHGVMASKANWRYNLPMFQEQFYNVAPDLLGHGESDKPRTADYSIPAQAGRLVALMDALGVEKFAVAGHSLGGMIAMYMAAAYPQRTHRVVNTSGIVYIPWYSWRRLVTWLSGVGAVVPGAYQLGLRVSKAPLLRPFFRQFDFYDLANCPADYETEEMRDAMLPGLEWATYHYLQAVERMDLRSWLSQIACRVMTVHGRQDQTVPVSQAYLVNRLVAHHRLEVVETCGHSVMIEQALHYNQLVMAFLTG